MITLQKQEVTKNEIVKPRGRLQGILNTHVIANFRAICKLISLITYQISVSLRRLFRNVHFDNMYFALMTDARLMKSKRLKYSFSMTG